ncbi:winged helix-turn-helix domain-containing protein [Shewanella maritima]|uniref:winged helix-turn-helix domain-containing protein n=1 Tax=Shewanella maritima TaxID=2520507 RepID=UPI003736CBE8
MAGEKYQIGNCVLDTKLMSLSRGENSVKLSAKVYELLILFLNSPDNIVSRQDAIETVWQGNQGVGEKGFTNAVWVIRKNFKELGIEEDIFLTLPKVGYQLILPNQQHAETTDISVPAMSNPQVLTLALVLILFTIILGQFFYSQQTQPLATPTPAKQLLKQKVTNFEGVEEHTAVSNNGQLLAMQWRAGDLPGKIYIKDLSRPNAPLNQISLEAHEEASPAWSAADDKLAYVRVAPSGVCEVRVRHLTNNTDDLIASDCFYLPFKRVLSWSHQDVDTLIYAKQLPDRVALVSHSLASGEAQQISFPGKNEVDFAPHELQSAQDIAFIREKSASMQMSLLVQGVNQVTHPLVENRVTIVDFDYSRQGGHFYVNYFDGSNLLVSKMNPQGEVLYQVPHSGMPSNLSFSDTNQALYISMHISKEYIAQFDLQTGQKLRAISSSSRDMYARYSLETDDILFISNRAKLWGVWKNNGASSKNLTKEMGNAGIPSVSPVSTEFVVSVNNNDQHTLYLGDLQSSLFEEIDLGGISAENLSWSRDGKAIYFKGTKGDSIAIYRYEFDTQQQTLVYAGDGNYVVEGEAPHILYLSRFNQNGIWRLDTQTEQISLFTNALAKYDFGSFYYQDNHVYFISRTNDLDKIERQSINGELDTVMSFPANTVRKFFGLSQATNDSLLLTLKVANEADVNQFTF